MAMMEDNKDNRQKSDEILKAKKRAMLILQHNDRTEWELTDKLNKAGFSEEAVESAVEYVRSFHYIDDERYAKRFVEIYHDSIGVNTKSVKYLSRLSKSIKTPKTVSRKKY